MTLTRERIRHELARRSLTVLRVARATPRITRITLGGPDLAGFTSPGPPDHVKLFFPGGESRDYTPAAFRPATGEHPDELDLDFVVHGDEGPATAWAAHAVPGDTLVVAGPRGSQLAPQGVSRLVIVVDETAFPATGRWFEAAGDELPIDVLVWPTDASPDEYFGDRIPARAAVSTYAPGELPTALRSLAPFDESTFFFLAGEAETLVPLRRYLRRELGLPPEQVQASGYWRYGAAGLDHHAPLDPTDPD